MIFPHIKPSKLPSLLTFLIFGVAIGIFFILFFSSKETLTTGEKHDLEMQADLQTRNLQERMEVYIQALYGARGMAAADENLSSTQWRKFFQNMGISKRLPGLATMAFVELVPAANKEQFAKNMQNDTSLSSTGIPDFEIKTDREKSEYLVIKYVEPSSFATFQKTVGFDFFSDPVRSEAAVVARDTNQPIITSPTKSLSTQKSAFLIVLPLYRDDQPVVTPEQRRAAFRGLVTEGFYTQELFDQAFSGLVAVNGRVLVYSGDRANPDFLIYVSANQAQVLGASFGDKNVELTRQIKVLNQTWTLQYSLPVSSISTPIISTLSARLAVVILTNILTALVIWQHFYKKKLT